MSYDHWKTTEPDDPYSEPAESNPIVCRGCGDYLGDANTTEPIQPVVTWNGFPWCAPCGAEMKRLEKSHEPDHMDQVKR